MDNTLFMQHRILYSLKYKHTNGLETGPSRLSKSYAYFVVSLILVYLQKFNIKKKLYLPSETKAAPL